MFNRIRALRFAVSLTPQAIAVIFAVLAMAYAVSRVAGEDDATRARVALALAGPKCGTCLETARAEAVKTGKPLVIFVGAAYTRAADLPANCIPVRVPTYDRDGLSGPRIVIVRSHEGTLTVADTFPPDVSATILRTAVGGKPKWKS